MPVIPNEGTPRKDLTVFFILDTSGSMEGTKIVTLNRAMRETVAALKKLAKKNGDAKLKIAVMEFNSGCTWITASGPEDLEEEENFVWDDLKAGGLTDVGAALLELDSKLSRDAFLGSMVGAMMPVIIFMSDGHNTDNYEAALEQIRRNKWFACGTKIGFALGDEADVKMIASVVGDSEAVIQTSDMETFEKLMKFVAVTSTMLNGESHTTKIDNSGAAVLKKGIQDGVLDSKDVCHLPQNSYNPEPEPDVDGDEADWDV